MRSLINVANLPSSTDKFYCPNGGPNGPFNITHTGLSVQTVAASGQVLDPPGGMLLYCHEDPMSCTACGYTGVVKDFLTVDPCMDTPSSQVW